MSNARNSITSSSSSSIEGTTVPTEKEMMIAEYGPIVIERSTAEQLIAKYGSKANAIRALDKQGMARKDIAKTLNLIYQHVRNTLEYQPKKVGAK